MFKIRLIKIRITRLEIIMFNSENLFLRLKITTKPGNNPVRMALKVNPGWKPPPCELIMKPSKSPTTPVIAPNTGPKTSPDSIKGILPKLKRTEPPKSIIAPSLVRTIFIATKIAAKTKDLVENLVLDIDSTDDIF